MQAAESVAFANALRANPNDSAAYCAFADWLSEHGLPAHSAIVASDARSGVAQPLPRHHGMKWGRRTDERVLLTTPTVLFGPADTPFPSGATLEPRGDADAPHVACRWFLPAHRGGKGLVVGGFVPLETLSAASDAEQQIRTAAERIARTAVNRHRRLARKKANRRYREGLAWQDANYGWHTESRHIAALWAATTRIAADAARELGGPAPTVVLSPSQYRTYLDLLDRQNPTCPSDRPPPDSGRR